MPRIERPDGAELHWEQRGEGPLVVIAQIGYAPPSRLEPLITDLAVDRRVVTYHPRGTGESSRTEPYEIETDAFDLAAVVEAAGPPAVVVALADGCNRAVRAAAERPDLITHVLAPGPPVFGRPPDPERSGDGLAASPPVLVAFLQLLETDYRAALNTMIKNGNPGIDEEGIRVRVDAIAGFSSHEATAARMRAWIADDAWAPAAALGERLWVLSHGRNPWFGDVGELARELLPDAHIELIEDGPFDRPDLTAAAVRRLTAVQAG